MQLITPDPAMLTALVPVLALTAGILIWAIIDIVRKPVRHLNKPLWILIVLLVIPLGAITYFIIGRTRGHALSEDDLR